MPSIFLVIFSFFALLFSPFSINNERSTLTWIDMEDVVVLDVYDNVLESYILSPIFGQSIQTFDQKEVEVTGYVVFVSEENNVVMLSRNDFASCFFCGAAGPESVMEVYMEPGMPSLDRDRVITVQGVFKLNQDDPTKNFYLMEKGVITDM